VIVTTRPWFTIEAGAIVLDRHGDQRTVLARPTAELAVLGGATLSVVDVIPTDYAPVIEPDENDALTVLYVTFPGIAIIGGEPA